MPALSVLERLIRRRGRAVRSHARVGDRLIESSPCPACGYDRTRPLFAVLGAKYVACAQCGLARMSPMPPASDLLSKFGSAYFEGGSIPGGYDDYAADEALHRANARSRLAQIAKQHPGPPGRYLDIGCAFGYALDEARKAGWDAVGVEPSPGAAARARGLGLDVYADPAAALAAHPEGFDVVSLCQVLSHVPDPARVVREAAACIKPSGLLFIETWRRDAFVARLSGRHWHVISPPTVVWLETTASLRVLLARSGLDIIDWTAGHKRVSVRFVAALLKDRPAPTFLMRFVQRAARALARVSLLYPFHDLIWITSTPVA